MWKYIVSGAVIGSLGYFLIKHFRGRVCACPGRLDGLVVVVTGANSGIGKALCVELAKRGAVLVLACRDFQKGLKAKDYILSQLGDKAAKIVVKLLDLTSFSSIRAFSKELEVEFNEIYALVNNAGIFYHPHKLTCDGFEVTLQTNYLGPFVLTHHLLPLLRKAEHARIINVASDGHRLATVEALYALTRSQNEDRSQFVKYGVSKLALILFTKELAKRLKGTNVIVNAVDPGNVETNIFRTFPPLANPILFALQWPIRFFVIKTPKEGCQTPLHALLTSNRSTGEYYSECKLAVPSPIACSDKIAKEYYGITLEVLADKFDTESEC